jgi:outer membrane protein assembly factor BamE (lipoprotein component of BamABCDE complex)
MRSTLPALRASCVLLCALLLVACQPGKRITKANVDQVQEGMAKKQVESILGLPTSVETRELDLNTKTTFVYVQGEDTVTIVFWGDKLETKQSTLKE